MGKEQVVTGDVSVPVVVNVADDARNLSATTVSALPEKADVLKGKVESEEKPVDVVEDKETDVSEETETPTDSSDIKKKSAVDRRVEEIDQKAKEAQSRINEATKQRKQRERELATEKKKNEELLVEIERLKTVKPATAKPKQEDFENESEFIEALTDWKLDARLSAEKSSQESDSAADYAEQREFTITEKIRQLMSEGPKKYKDFNEVAANKDSYVPFTQDMAEIVATSDVGTDLLYYLAGHVDIAEEIAEMDKLSAARAIGRIEEGLPEKKAQSKNADKEVVFKKTTNAPPPIKPVSTDSRIDKDPANMTIKEYRAWREQH